MFLTEWRECSNFLLWCPFGRCQMARSAASSAQAVATSTASVRPLAVASRSVELSDADFRLWLCAPGPKANPVVFSVVQWHPASPSDLPSPDLGLLHLGACNLRLPCRQVHDPNPADPGQRTIECHGTEEQVRYLDMCKRPRCALHQKCCRMQHACQKYQTLKIDDASAWHHWSRH